jgi:excisionase family DNA binding protein
MVNSEHLCISVSEAAKLLNISRNLAYSLAKQGELPGAIKLGKKRIVVSRIQLEALIRGKSNNEQ